MTIMADTADGRVTFTMLLGLHLQEQCTSSSRAGQVLGDLERAPESQAISNFGIHSCAHLPHQARPR